MRMKRIGIVTAIVVSLGGCETSGGMSDEAFAAKVPDNYRAQIASYLRSTLKDPYSVRDAEISSPTTAFVSLLNGGITPGVCVRLNAKNGFGGYTGLETLSISFRHGTIVGSGPPMYNICQNVSWSPFTEINGTT